MKRIFILFLLKLCVINAYAQQASSASARISPGIVTAGASFQSFTYVVNLSGGTADSIGISNPFDDHAIFVTAISVDGNNQFISNQDARPETVGFVSWFYDIANDVLSILADTSAIQDSIVITFVANIPTSVASNLAFPVSVDDAADSESPIAADDQGWSVNIIAGPTAKIRIENARYGLGKEVNILGLSTDEYFTFYAIGLDEFDNFSRHVKANWSVTNGIGILEPATNSDSSVFNPTRVGIGTIGAGNADFRDVTGLIVVKGGALNHVIIRDGPDDSGKEVSSLKMTTDSSLILYATGYDADRNYLRAVSGKWRTTNTLDSLSTQGQFINFQPLTAGTSGQIIFESGGFLDSTGTIQVSAGKLNHLIIRNARNGGGSTIDSLTLRTNQDTVFYAAGYDADHNHIRDLSVNWSVSGNIGSVMPTSADSTIFSADRIGNGSVVARFIADNDTLRATTGIIKVIGGALSSIKIRDGSNGGGREVGSFTMTTDSSVTFYAAGYDADSNYVGDVEALWDSTGNLEPPPPRGPFITYQPSKAGRSGTIRARNSSFTDETGNIEVRAGRLHHLTIRNSRRGTGNIVDSLALTTDQNATFYAAGYDADGNYITESRVLWSVNGGIGRVNTNQSFSDSTNFFADRIGNGNVAAQFITDSDTLRTVTGVIKVIGGILRNIKITNGANGGGQEIDSLTVTTDSSVTLYAAGYDAKGNFLRDVKANWSREEGNLDFPLTLGTTQVIFQPSKAPTSGKIKAESSGILDTTGLIKVKVGALHHLMIRDSPSGGGNVINSLILTTDETPTFFAAGYDADSNHVRDVHVHWSVNGGIGSVHPEDSAATVFIAETIGNGTVQADSSSFRVETGVIYVRGGKLSSIRIRDGTNNGGIEVDSLIMTTDSSLTLYAAGYDAKGNYLREINASWKTLGFLEPISEPPSRKIVFAPDKPGNGWIYADTLEVSGDSTGIIEVIHPPILAYKQGTLTPTTVTLNMDTSFTIAVANHGNVGVMLDTTSFLAFTDGESDTFKAYLAAPQSIGIGEDNVVLQFKRDRVPPGMNGGAYTPFFTAIGLDDSKNDYRQDIQTQINGLVVAVIKIDAIFVSEQEIPPGRGNLALTMTITNSSGVTADSVKGYPTFGSLSGEYTWERTDTISRILPGQHVLAFRVSSDRNATPGTVIIDGNVSALVNKVLVTDNDAVLKDSLIVSLPPRLNYIAGSLNRGRVSQGQTVTFSLKVQNAGFTTPVTLHRGGTSLSFSDGINSVTAVLENDVIVPGNKGLANLDFSPVNIPSAINAQTYSPVLSFDGTDGYGDRYNENALLQNDAIQVQAAVNLAVVDGTNLPDTVTQGQLVSFQVEVENRGEADAILEQDQTKITFGVGATTYSAELFSEPLIPGNSRRQLIFDSITIPAHMADSSYTPHFVFSGEDSNKQPFFLRDSAGIGDLIVQTPPVISYVGGFSPTFVLRGLGADFELNVQNNGQAGVYLDTTSVLVLEFSTQSLRVPLKERTYVPGFMRSQILLQFPALQIPALISATTAPCHLNLRGEDQNGKPYAEENIAVDSISLGTERGPDLTSCRFIDGGYRNIPDGEINQGDLILIKFNEKVAANASQRQASQYFSVVSEGDSLGGNARIKTSDEVGYIEVDKDSILFVQIGENPVLATNSASNRDKNNAQGLRRTVIKAESSPSLVIINPKIEKDLIKGETGGDAGFETNRAFLLAQLDSLRINSSDSPVFSKYALLVDDKIPPVVLNVYPPSNAGSQSYISPYTNVKAFVSGRNFVYHAHLKTYLNALLQTSSSDTTEKYINDCTALINKLKQMRNGADSTRAFSFLDSLRSYSPLDRNKPSPDSVIVPNPVARMFTDVSNTIGYAYTSILSRPSPELFESVSLTNSTESDTVACSFMPTYNVTVENRSPIPVVPVTTGGKVYIWFNLNAVLKDGHQVTYVDSFAVDPLGEGQKSRGEYKYTIRTAPNPFEPGSGEMVIEYEIPEESTDKNIEILIIDSAGRLVRRWGENVLNNRRGRYRISRGWDGRNDGGITVSRGIYVCYLRINNDPKASWYMAIK